MATDRDPFAGTQDSNTNDASGDRVSEGVGMASSHTVDAKRAGIGEGSPGSDRSQGEVGGAGSIYSAQLNERPNISNPRNQGPTRAPSRIGSTSMPVITMAKRNTGKIS